MIEYILCNLLESDADALANAVNTVGVMGKSIALQVRAAFPENYAAYQNACKQGHVQRTNVTAGGRDSFRIGTGA